MTKTSLFGRLAWFYSESWRVFNVHLSPHVTQNPNEFNAHSDFSVTVWIFSFCYSDQWISDAYLEWFSLLSKTAKTPFLTPLCSTGQTNKKTSVYAALCSWCYYNTSIYSSNNSCCGARLCLRVQLPLANRRPLPLLIARFICHWQRSQTSPLRYLSVLY